MSNSILNIYISCFENCSSTIPRSINLLSWLTSEMCRDKVEQIRNIQDEDLQKVIKVSLPAITPSGVYSYRAEKDLIEHSGFLAFDIDLKDNRHISNFDNLKQKLSNIPNIAYCGLSVRGKGYWGLIPVPKSTPEVHKQRFAALMKDFKEFGIILDPSGGDVCHLRIYSWDQDAYFNHSAITYSKLLDTKRKIYSRPILSHTRKKVEAIISQIKDNGIDITEDYKEGWLKIAAALANEFGEAGRGYFHEISMFHPKYSIKETDRMFDACLKHEYKKVTIGTFFHIASEYGIITDPKPIQEPQARKDLTPVKPSAQKSETLVKSVITPTSVVDNDPIVKKGLWDSEIMELEEFFKTVKLPPGPIWLDAVTKIPNPAFTINAELNIIKAQNGKTIYKNDLERLQALKRLLVN